MAPSVVTMGNGSNDQDGHPAKKSAHLQIHRPPGLLTDSLCSVCRRRQNLSCDSCRLRESAAASESCGIGIAKP